MGWRRAAHLLALLLIPECSKSNRLLLGVTLVTRNVTYVTTSRVGQR